MTHQFKTESVQFCQTSSVSMGFAWFFLCMDSLMPHKLRIPTKQFPTYLAAVQLLSSVDSLMVQKGCILSKAFPTLLALVWLLTSVDSPVNDKN